MTQNLLPRPNHEWNIAIFAIKTKINMLISRDKKTRSVILTRPGKGRYADKFKNRHHCPNLIISIYLQKLDTIWNILY